MKVTRAVAVAYALAAALVILLILPALRPPQPPPPPTAEFAPQAIKQITQAPAEQAAQAGTGPQGTSGAGLGAGPSPVPSPSSSPPQQIQTPRIKHCVGDPPRQIEDTQSPPCIPYFDGDNGGATSDGVTATEIRIMMPDATWNNPPDHLTTDVVQFFNSRFQFYGRKLVVVGPGNSFGCGGNPAQMQSGAQNVAKQHIFAVNTCGDSTGGLEYYFYDALAKLGVMSFTSRADTRTESHLQQYAPYEWSYLPTLERQEANLAELTCKGLKGGAPAFTTPNPTTPTRVFGIVTEAYGNGPSPSIDELNAQLSACGIVPKDVKQMTHGGGTTDQTEVSQAKAIATQMQTDGVTSVLCVCHINEKSVLQSAATSQGWFPEWVIQTFAYNDQEVLNTDQQTIHQFGVSAWNKYVTDAQSVWWQPVQQQDPTFTPANHPFYRLGLEYLYPAMLLMASAIQMAGPILTPANVQAALYRTTFPNPDSPIYEGKVGFEGDHAMVKDVTLLWISASDPGPLTGSSGTWCYVNHGRRLRLGNFPAGPSAYTFQQRPCDAGT